MFYFLKLSVSGHIFATDHAQRFRPSVSGLQSKFKADARVVSLTALLFDLIVEVSRHSLEHQSANS